MKKIKRPATAGTPKSKIKKLKIGIVGFGTIGQVLAKAIDSRFKARAKLVAIYDINRKKLKIKRQSLRVNSMKELIEKSDLVIESASVNISANIVEKVIDNQKDVLVMSTGGLLGKEELFDKARKKGCSIYLPSGALAGCDGLKAARFGRLHKVTLTTRKPPGAFGIDSIKQETVLFEGGVKEAIRRFPQNINVSATLAMLSGDERKVFVRILTSPRYTTNIHEVKIEGDFGKIITRTDNIPSEINPRTSQLAIISAIATLNEIFDVVRIGT